MHFTGTSTIQEQRSEEASSRALDSCCVDRIRNTLANINPFGSWPTPNWVKNQQRMSAFTCSGKTSRRRSVPTSTVVIRVGGPRTVVFWKRSELAPTFISPLDRLYESSSISTLLPLVVVADGFPGLTSTNPPNQMSHSTGILFGLLGRLLNEYLVNMFSSVGRKQPVLRETARPEPNCSVAPSGRNHRGWKVEPVPVECTYQRHLWEARECSEG